MSFPCLHLMYQRSIPIVLKFNFAAVNSSVEQLSFFLILTGTNHLTQGLFLFSSGRQMTSVYLVGVSLK